MLAEVLAGLPESSQVEDAVQTGRLRLACEEPGELAVSLPVRGSHGDHGVNEVVGGLTAVQGPGQAILALGYSGWGPGQLEDEIRDNGWLAVDSSPELVFASDADGKWAAALSSIGVDPLTLSATAGRA